LKKKGYDLETVEVVPEEARGEFRELTEDGKGYFRHTGGVTAVLRLLGVDFDTEVERKQYPFEDEETGELLSPQTCKADLACVMTCNTSMQVTPDECRSIAEKLQQENLAEALHMIDQMDARDHDINDEINFFNDFQNFCVAASKYGGFYNCWAAPGSESGIHHVAAKYHFNALDI